MGNRPHKRFAPHESVLEHALETHKFGNNIAARASNGPAPYVIAAGRSCLEDYQLRAEDQASPAPSKAKRSYRYRLKRVPPVLTPFQRFVCIPPLVFGLQHRSSLSSEYANLTKSEDHFRQALRRIAVIVTDRAPLSCGEANCGHGTPPDVTKLSLITTESFHC